jgi:hypothetical protein
MAGVTGSIFLDVNKFSVLKFVIIGEVFIS